MFENVPRGDAIFLKVSFFFLFLIYVKINTYLFLMVSANYLAN